MKTMGIDIGTTSICGVVIDCECKTLIKSKTIDNDSSIKGQSYEKIQDPIRILEICTYIYKGFIKEFDDIISVGITGQMHGILYLDQLGNVITPLYTWQDERGSLIYKNNLSYCEYMSKVTDSKLATGYGFVTLYYNEINKVVPQYHKICTIHDFIAMKFANLHEPIIHVSDLASFGLFDMGNLNPNLDKMNALYLNPHCIPKYLKAVDYIGVTKDNIKVLVAIGDNQASVYGATKGECALVINIGTGSQISQNVKKYNSCGLEYRPYLDNDYLIVGCALCGGYSYSLLKNFFLKTLEIFKVNADVDVYKCMEEAITDYDFKTDKPVFDTRFLGTRNEPTIRASLSNISELNFTPNYLTASTIEGIVQELYNYYTKFISVIDSKPKIMYGSGNGLRRNKYMQSVVEEKFNLTLKLPLYEEEASYGVALLCSK